MTIEPINANWGAKAAAGDAMERAPNEAPFLAVWLHPEKGVQWSKANTDFASLAMMQQVVNEFASSCVRVELENKT